MAYERPERLDGLVRKIKMPCGSFWIIIGVDQKGYPREVFGEGSKKGTCRAWIEAGGRLATKLLQDGQWNEVIDAVKQIRCPACMRKMGTLNSEEKQAHPWSCGDAIAKEIEYLLEKRKEKK